MAGHISKYFVKSHEKCLLYLDILGFSDLVRRRPEMIPRLYHIIANANVQKQGDFEVIVFSDTILVYNLYPPDGDEPMSPIDWLCEFCQDLFYRLSAIDVFFRAVIVDGSFQHYTLGKSPCFFGDGLIDAYRREKKIKSVGAFIHSKCLRQGSIFDTVKHSANLSFVLLTQQLSAVLDKCGDHFPVPPIFLETVNDLYLGFEVGALRRIHALKDDLNLAPPTRQKYSTAWGYYIQKLGRGLELLGESGFDPSSIGLADDLDLAESAENISEYPARLLDSQYGYVMAFAYSTWNDHFERAVADAVIRCLDPVKFSGRCEYYHGRRELPDRNVYWVGLGLKTMKGKQIGEPDWWESFETAVLQELAIEQVPLTATRPNESWPESLKALRSVYDFCGAVMIRDGKPDFILEHPECQGTSSFTEGVKRKIYRSVRFTAQSGAP